MEFYPTTARDPNSHEFGYSGANSRFEARSLRSILIAPIH